MATGTPWYLLFGGFRPCSRKTALLFVGPGVVVRSVLETASRMRIFSANYTRETATILIVTHTLNTRVDYADAADSCPHISVSVPIVFVHVPRDHGQPSW